MSTAQRFGLVVLAGVILILVGSYLATKLDLATTEEGPLIFVVIPAEEGSLTEEQYAPFLEYLTNSIGREVELKTVSDYNAVIEALKYGHADIGRPSTASYVLAKDEGVGIEVFAFAINGSTGKPSYQSYIIARTDRGITDLNGKTVAFADPGSTSGYLVPMVYFMEAGIETGKIFFAGSHSAVIEAVKNGTVDVGTVADKRLTIALKEGVITEGEVEILWQSDPIPNVPYVVRGDMDEKLKAAIKAAWLNAPLDVIEAQAINEIGYIEAKDSDLDPVREVQALKAKLEK